MTLEEPLVSIIVPVYKVEAYLDRCIRSIVQQQYKNLEIILVDDGSPDQCPGLCDRWRKKDARIRVIHKQNGGISDARNAGLEAATGELFMFVDGDDYLDEKMCRKLWETMKTTDADVVSSDFYCAYDDGRPFLTAAPDQRGIRVLSGREAVKEYCCEGKVELTVVWNKLYRRKLFLTNPRILFPVGRYHEDNQVIYQLFYRARKVALIPYAGYYYVQRPDSIMGRFNEKNVTDLMVSIKNMLLWSETVAPEMNPMMQYACQKRFLRWTNMSQNPDLQWDKAQEEEFRRFIRNHAGNNYLMSPYASGKDRVVYLLHQLHLYQTAAKIYKRIKR